MLVYILAELTTTRCTPACAFASGCYAQNYSVNYSFFLILLIVSRIYPMLNKVHLSTHFWMNCNYVFQRGYLIIRPCFPAFGRAIIV